MTQSSYAFFIYELKSILRAQVALIPEGVTIRGAITVGNIVQSWDVVYGPAVVRAYDLESAKPGHPRIVIDEEALSLLDPELDGEKLISELGLARRDGTTIYLDYLNACDVELRAQDDEYQRFLEIHRDFIKKALARYSNSAEVLPKYEWLRRYHQCILKERFGLDIPPHLNV